MSIDLSAAATSEGPYRYWLRREVAEAGPLGLFVMLNPSTADATGDDNTIRRCVGVARTQGWGGFGVVNLFAWRATDPDKLWACAADRVGPLNDFYVAAAAKQAACVVCAWGGRPQKPNARVAYAKRVGATLAMLTGAGAKPKVLALTGRGEPRHPLYVSVASLLLDYPGADRARYTPGAGLSQ